jgi:hypothetical protein
VAHWSLFTAVGALLILLAVGATWLLRRPPR